MLVGHDRRPRLIRSNLEYVTLARLFLLAANHRERRRHNPSTLGPGWSKPSFLGPGWSKASFLGKKVGIFFFACGGLEDLPTYHGCAVTRETQPLVCTVHASPARSPDSASNGFQSAPLWDLVEPRTASWLEQPCSKWWPLRRTWGPRTSSDRSGASCPSTGVKLSSVLSKERHPELHAATFYEWRPGPADDSCASPLALVCQGI